MREHTLRGTGGLTYAEMGSISPAEDPSDPGARTTRRRPRRMRAASRSLTAPATSGSRRPLLTTALNMGFMSEMLALFSIVVGIALLQTGIGLVILAMAVFGRGRTDAHSRLQPRTRSGDRVVRPCNPTGRCGASSHLSVHQRSSGRAMV